MNRSRIIVSLAAVSALGFAAPALAGAPQPDQRQGDFVHVCKGGPNKADACTVATEDVDCPRSACIVRTLGTPIRGRLTIIAHDTVTDWLAGTASNRALTVMLEVRAPDHSKQILAATYQDLTTPTEPPQAPGEVVAIPMDELALRNLASGVGGSLFIRPESQLAAQLRTLYAVSAGTPVISAVFDRSALSADHVDDGLATVLRFDVRIQFVEEL